MFPKAGRELTGDISYSTSENSNNGVFNTQYYDIFNAPLVNINKTKQEGNGGNDIITSQFDFINPLKEKSKIEMGVKAIFNFPAINKLADAGLGELVANGGGFLGPL